MNTITKDMILGFSQENEAQTIYVKQGDSQRKIQFELIDENDDYVINDVSAIYFRERFSDGTSIFPIKVYPTDDNNTVLTSGSILTVQLTELMTDVPGMAYCELMFIKTDGIFDIDPVTEQIIGNFDVLTTQTFNLYIEPSVSNDSKVHSETSTDILLQLVIATKALNDKVTAFEEGGTYTDATGTHTITYENSRQGKEETRTSNETTRISQEDKRVAYEQGGTYTEDETSHTISPANSRQGKESERQRTEQERMAFEGIGDYTTHESVTYTDASGNEHTVLYKDSRRGSSERERALLYGGDFIDVDGTHKSVSNSYVYDGQTYNGDVEDLDDKSLMAIGAISLKAMNDNYGYTQSAHEYATQASSYKDAAATSATNASNSATNAATSATNAATSASDASNSAISAAASATSAATSAASAEQIKTDSEAWAVGTRNGSSVPPTDPTYNNNSKHWAEQAESIAQSLSGVLQPKGTVASNRITDPTATGYIDVSTANPGDMYNISDEFVTTSDFVEGAGRRVPLGSNIYVTINHKWDILAGSPVTGVKGENETNYRTGNINITKIDIGLGNVTNNRTSYSATEPTGGNVGDIWIGPV